VIIYDGGMIRALQTMPAKADANARRCADPPSDTARRRA
jgi:hypothetical protein